MWNTLNKYAPAAVDEKTGKRKEMAIDAWSCYCQERDEILDYIRQNNITGVVLLSGDSHFSGAFCWNSDNDGKCEFLEFLVGPFGMGTDVIPTFPTKRADTEDTNLDCQEPSITTLFAYNQTKAFGSFHFDTLDDRKNAYGIFSVVNVDGAKVFSLLFRPDGSTESPSIDQVTKWSSKGREWKERTRLLTNKDLRANGSPFSREESHKAAISKRRKPVNVLPLALFFFVLLLFILICMNDRCLEGLNTFFRITRKAALLARFEKPRTN